LLQQQQQQQQQGLKIPSKIPEFTAAVGRKTIDEKIFFFYFIFIL